MVTKKRPIADMMDTRLQSLRRQSKDDLAKLLAELADRHPAVEERLARHAISSDPARLAAEFRGRLQTLKRSRRFHQRSEATSFGRMLESWIAEVECELLPLAPERAFQLADAFVRNDKNFFEQADDSDGAIGDAIRAGCRLWLRAASMQSDRDSADSIGRVHTLVKADEYGAREALLAHSDLLFDETGLRSLASRFEADLDKALHAQSTADKIRYGVYKAAAAIGLIADVLRDPDLSTKTTLRYSPNPNDVQKERFAERYIRFGRPSDALAWLASDWGHREHVRERLLADVYAALGDTDSLRMVRQALFERTGSTSDFEAWCQTLATAERASAAEVARERAKRLNDPITAAQLLLSLNDEKEAEALLVERQAAVRGGDYGRLVPLAQTLEKKGFLLGSIICYRALLMAILGRAYARAYGHAAEYLIALRRLDARVVSYGPLTGHQALESSIRGAHGRKVSFWNRIRG